MLTLKFSLEYMSHDFSSFCFAHGIIPQNNCAHTSQQNEVVERKNHNLLDVTHTLMTNEGSCFILGTCSSYFLFFDKPYAILPTSGTVSFLHFIS